MKGWGGESHLASDRVCAIEPCLGGAVVDEHGGLFFDALHRVFPKFGKLRVIHFCGPLDCIDEIVREFRLPNERVRRLTMFAHKGDFSSILALLQGT